MSKSTPWGPSQHQKQAAPGIVFYSTAGHGGFHLSASRMMEFRQVFPAFQTWASGPWFEEDADYSMVVLAFAHNVFNDEQVRDAVRQVQRSKDGYFAEAQRWLAQSVGGSECCKRADAFDADHAELWERGSMGTTDVLHLWWVSMRRVRDGERRECRMDLDLIYSKRFFTTEEVEQHAVAA